MGALLESIANFNPTGFALKNDQAAATIGQTKANTGDLEAQTAERNQLAQLRAQQAKDAEGMRDIFGSYGPGSNPNDLLKKAATTLSGPGFMQFQGHLQGMQKAANDLTEQQHKIAEENHQAIGAVLASVKSAPPEAQAALYQQALPTMRQHLSHEDAPLPDQYPGSTALDFLIGLHHYSGTVLANAKEKAGIKKIDAEATKEQLAADSARHEQAANEYRALPVNPQNGVPDPQAVAAIQQKYPGAPLPTTPEGDKAFRNSLVPQKDLPAYETAMREQASLQKLAANPEQGVAQINALAPPGDPDAVRAIDQFKFKLKGGDFKGAAAVIDDFSKEQRDKNKSIEIEKAKAPIRITVNAARQEAALNASGVTEDDFRRAGIQSAITGEMPPLGRDALSRLKVMHYAQEYARESGMTPRDMAVAKAAFRGDSASLANFQKQRDQIVAFEQTAQKNLDLFLSLAAKIPDTGSPWINKPIRTLDEKAVGSENMAAVNAARQVANNEVAKVTSGGGLSGVLSDSARNEVKDYNPASATFAQTKAIARVLKQDMANRHASMDTALEEIKGRIGGGAPAAPATPVATHRYNPATGKIDEIK